MRIKIQEANLVNQVPIRSNRTNQHITTFINSNYSAYNKSGKLLDVVPVQNCSVYSRKLEKDEDVPSTRPTWDTRSYYSFNVPICNCILPST